jgi:adenine-specific DNA-methyltransferase
MSNYKKMQLELTYKDFPSTRYQGSKRKIVPWIYKNTKDLKFRTVLDGCGGSASVSYLFKKMGKQVSYNDKLEFNFHIGRSLIENQNVIFSKEDVHHLLNNDLNNPNTISKLFSGIYYLDQENSWLDNVGYGILNMNHYTGNILEIKKSIAYNALFQACLTKRPFNLFHRNNLQIRTKDVKRNFGNKKTWEKDFSSVFEHFIDEINSKVFDSGIPCNSLNKSIFEIDEIGYDLVYLDPPYHNKERTNETSNYHQCYHFLEGIVNYDNWESMIDYNSKNRRLLKNDAENLFSKTNIYQSFEVLISKFRKSKIIVSYKYGGIPSIDYIVKTMKKHKKIVYTRSLPYIYALNKSNGAKTREVLIIGI